MAIARSRARLNARRELHGPKKNTGRSSIVSTSTGRATGRAVNTGWRGGAGQSPAGHGSKSTISGNSK
nr:hypothetical protein Iba_chr02cCG12070 [Ipomoea batatas]